MEWFDEGDDIGEPPTELWAAEAPPVSSDITDDGHEFVLIGANPESTSALRDPHATQERKTQVWGHSWECKRCGTRLSLPIGEIPDVSEVQGVKLPTCPETVVAGVMNT